jgi:hypothetical protein
MASSQHRVFRVLWLGTDLLLKLTVLALLYTCAWEFSVRQYLRGFSNAIVPIEAAPEKKVEAILDWMRVGPARSQPSPPEGLAQRDPETTLNHQELLRVCGTATNAFLNLARSGGLSVRRLLLLSPDRRAKHVVAEVLIDERWVIVDPAYRIILRDAHGRLLTRKDLQDPETFRQATNGIPGYLPEYNYDRFAHVRLARLPLEGLHLRDVLDAIHPGWDELIDWSLVLERESFAVLVLIIVFLAFLLGLRIVLGWYATRGLPAARFSLNIRLFGISPDPFSRPGIN